MIEIPAQSPLKAVATRLIHGLAQIHEAYDALLIDAWGVLHDGQSCYPGVLNCLEQLRQRGKSVVILSNAARRSAILRPELAAVGINETMYHDVLSSGELCWQSLRAGTANFTRGARAWYLGPQRSRSLCDGLDFDWCDDLNSCEFVLNTGAPQGNPADAERYLPLLRRMLERQLPMICANPDRLAVRAGVAGISAGAIARLYQKMGARHVIYFGKPQAEIYRQALALLGNPDQRRVLAVGDGLETDISGAANFGLDSLWITGGIHAAELSAQGGDVEALLAAQVVRPDWFCQLLTWTSAE